MKRAASMSVAAVAGQLIDSAKGKGSEASTGGLQWTHSAIEATPPQPLDSDIKRRANTSLVNQGSVATHWEVNFLCKTTTELLTGDFSSFVTLVMGVVAEPQVLPARRV